MKRPTQYKHKSRIKHYFTCLCSILLIANCLPANAESIKKDDTIIWTKITSRTTNSTPAKFEAPYPFTPEELWQNMLKIIALPEGYVTNTDVDNAFNIQLKFDEEFLTNKRNYFRSYYTSHYSVQRGVDWYFPIGVFEGINPTTKEKQSHFIFHWGQPLNKPAIPFQSAPENMCIKAQSVLPAIEALGWSEEYDLWDTTHGHPPGKQYGKGKRGKLVVDFNSDEYDYFTDHYTGQYKKQNPYQSYCLIDLQIWN